MSEEAIDETVVDVVTEEATAEVDAEATVTEEAIVNDELGEELPISESSPETEPKKDKGSVQKRIDELTADIYELREDRDYWRNQTQPKAEEVELVTQTLADFDYDEVKFAKHVREVATEDVRKTFANETAQQSSQRKMASFRTSERSFAEKHDDYYAVTNTPGLEISQDLAEVITDSEIGAQLAYHLGKNLKVSSRLSRMDYRSMVREVVKLEANLSAPPPVIKSKAPPPASKIKAIDAQADDGPGTTQKSFEKWRSKFRK